MNRIPNLLVLLIVTSLILPATTIMYANASPENNTASPSEFTNNSAHHHLVSLHRITVPHHHLVSLHRITVPHHHLVSLHRITVPHHHLVSLHRITVPHHHLVSLHRITVPHHHLVSLHRITVPEIVPGIVTVAHAIMIYTKEAWISPA